MPASFAAAATLSPYRLRSARRNARSPYVVHSSRNPRRGCANDGCSGMGEAVGEGATMGGREDFDLAGGLLAAVACGGKMVRRPPGDREVLDRKSTRLNSSHLG